MPDLFTPPGFDLKPFDPSRLTEKDRSFAVSFAETLPKVIEPSPGSEIGVAELTKAMRRATDDTRGFPLSSVRRLAIAVGFRVIRGAEDNYVQGVRLKDPA